MEIDLPNFQTESTLKFEDIYINTMKIAQGSETRQAIGLALIFHGSETKLTDQTALIADPGVLRRLNSSMRNEGKNVDIITTKATYARTLTLAEVYKNITPETLMQKLTCFKQGQIDEIGFQQTMYALLR